MKLCVAVMVHPAILPTYNRHLPLWQHHDPAAIVAFAPAEEPVAWPGAQSVAFGPHGHHGPESIDRFKFMLRDLAGRKEFTHFLIHEYDSVCLAPELPDMLLAADNLWGNLHHDIPGNPFGACRYVHPPLFCSARIMGKLAVAATAHTGHDGRGFWDRYLGVICEGASIPMAGYRDLGFSHNTIEPSLVSHAVEAIGKGSIFFHGIKSQECLEAILQAYAKLH